MRASALLLLPLVLVGLSAVGECRRRARGRPVVFGVTCPELSFESQCNGTAAVAQFSNGCARCKCSEGAARCDTRCPPPSARAQQRKCAKLGRFLRKMKTRKDKQLRPFNILCSNVTAETVCSHPKKNGFRFIDGCRVCNCTGVGQATCEPSGLSCPAPSRPKHHRKCAALLRKTKRRYKKSRRHNLKRCFQKFCKRNPTAKAFLPGCKPCQCRQKKCRKLGLCAFVGTTRQMHQKCREVRVV